jgi:hypothetical protein
LNPPVVAILLGMVMGLSPAGRAAMAATAARKATAAAGAALALPPELGLVQALAKAAFEVRSILASGSPVHNTVERWSGLSPHTAS